MKRGPRWHFRVAPPKPEAAAAAWRGRLFCCRGQDPPAPGPEAAAHTPRLDPGTRVPTRIIVARLPAGFAARCPLRRRCRPPSRRGTWPGSDPGGGRTLAALCGGL